MLLKNFTCVSPESLGIPSDALTALVRALGLLEYVHSFVLLRHGKACAAFCQAPFCAETPHQLFSLSKSFTACAVGLAQQEGKLKLTDRLVDFFPEYAADVIDEKMRRVTLRDLLTMRSGHEACPTAWLFGAKNYVQAFLASALATEPGSRFVYNSAASYMLAAVVRKVTHENVREYLIPRLFDPLEITPGIWESCPQGINFGGWGLYLKTADIAKFAQLLLQKGVWCGKSLLPADFLAEATSFQADNSMNALPDWKQGYGYHFWLSRHGFRGDGASGQYAIVLPQEDIAIAVTSALPNMSSALDLIWELLPRLSPVPLPEAPERLAELREVEKRMSIAPLPLKATGSRKTVRFRFRKNDAGIDSCEVAAGKDDCTLTFSTHRGSEQLRAGFGFHAFSTFQLTDRQPHLVAASAAWQNEHTLEIRSFILDGIYRDVWTIDFDDPERPVRNQQICACFRPLKPDFQLAMQEDQECRR